MASTNDQSATQRRCAPLAGSMLFAVRVLNREGSRFSQDDAVYEASMMISERYSELRTKMPFSDAREQAEAEWLTDYISSNTEVRDARHE